MLRYGVVGAAVLTVVAALTGGPAAGPARGAAIGPPAVDLASYVVADAGTGRILAADGMHERYSPASTLKVLTADTLMPGLDPAATVTPASASEFQAEPDGSVVGMSVGVTYTVADLWHAVFLVSGNDAITELSHLAGGTGATLNRMRAEAVWLGAGDTTVGDVDGYDVPGQVTSAYDLALFARAGLKMGQFRADCALTSAQFPGPAGQSRLLTSHDPMLLHYPGMIGIKGGITTLAGHTYIGAATRGGHTLIVTAMHGGADIWDQVTKLLDWGFAVVGKGTGVGWLGPVPAPTATTAAPTTPAPVPSPTPSPSPATQTPAPTPTETPARTVPRPRTASPAVTPAVSRPGPVRPGGDGGGGGPGALLAAAGAGGAVGVLGAAGWVRIAVGGRRGRRPGL